MQERSKLGFVIADFYGVMLSEGLQELVPFNQTVNRPRIIAGSTQSRDQGEETARRPGAISREASMILRGRTFGQSPCRARI